MNQNTFPAAAPDEAFSIPCPNCVWSEADDHEFLEHQRNLPELPRWKRILRRIASCPVHLFDCYYFIAVLSLFEMFSRTFAFFSIDAGFSFHKQLIIAAVAPVGHHRPLPVSAHH